MKFEDSTEYKKAKEEYNKRVFKNVLNPELVLPEIGYSCFDVLYLFYDSKYIDQIFSLFKQEFEYVEDGDGLTLPIHIGFQEPKLEKKYIFGEERKCIMLWYDKQEEFMKNQITMFNKKQ
jgi:hypothetical protein